MITDIAHWLLATFLLGPIQAEVDRTLAAAQAPRAVIEKAEACMASAIPALTRRASEDWTWGVTTAIMVTTGLSRPETVLAREVPACGGAMRALGPLLRAEAG